MIVEIEKLQGEMKVVQKELKKLHNIVKTITDHIDVGVDMKKQTKK